VSTITTLQSLAARTFSFLRKHPILFVPVFMAELLGLGVLHLRRTFFRMLLVTLFSTHDSVLSPGHRTFALSAEDLPKATLLGAPLEWASYFINIYIHVAALVAISVLVRTITNDESTNFRAISIAFREKKRQLFIFSAALSLSFIPAAGVLYALVWTIGNFQSLNRWMGFNFGVFIGLVVELPLVYFFAWRALTLLSATEAPPESASERLAILSGIITIVTQAVLVLLIQHAPALVFRPTTEIGALFQEAVTSLIAALPYVPLFVALSLLAEDNEKPAEATSA
jgi:hypothetical protein